MAEIHRRSCAWGRIGARIVVTASLALGVSALSRAHHVVLKPDQFAHHVARFNAAEPEDIVNLIPNAQAWAWLVENAPLFECPAVQFEETYYFRWWTFRKHICQTPTGRVLTEFIQPVNHAGPYNTVACAFGHHLAEGRWLRGQAVLDEYSRFWFRSGPTGGAAEHFHKFSSWAAAALYDRTLATGDRRLVVELLDDLVADYRVWEQERAGADGLFWQFDVRDGMEESISGSRTAKNIRPTINSYMVANARAIARVAEWAGRPEIAHEFTAKADALQAKLLAALWGDDAKFFKVRLENGQYSNAREAIGFIPWTFGLAGPKHAAAWAQIKDPAGFWAPWGLTTAERRHPAFRTHGTGTCEWDGAVWPFATSQTLRGLANVLRGPEQPYVTRRHYFEQLVSYARSHQLDGRAYLGEYLDETTGKWLITGPKAQRSRYYNHSTFNDLVITGLVGLVPREDEVVEIDPLLPVDAWDWFCVDGVPYHGRSLTIAWDRMGERYGRGVGLAVWADGVELARSPTLKRLTGELPKVEPVP
jgi:hypothetical protein